MDQSLLDFAVDLARRAGAFAAERFFAGDVAATRKPDGTEVTATDLAVEELIRAALARHAPDDEVYGEEAGTTEGTSGRRWIIDPIDGASPPPRPSKCWSRPSSADGPQAVSG